MLNLIETLELSKFYLIQRNFYLKAIIISFGTFEFVDLLRLQVSEINLLQLVPGLYLGLLFVAFFVMMTVSDFLAELPKKYDLRKDFGTKTAYRPIRSFKVKISTVLFSLGIVGTLITILPLSLDSFNNYTEKTVESLWSFQEVLEFEHFMLFLLICLFQWPMIGILPRYRQTQLFLFSSNLKGYSFATCVLAGVLTPTVDVFSQVMIFSIAVGFYFFILLFFTKQTPFLSDDLPTFR